MAIMMEICKIMLQKEQLKTMIKNEFDTKYGKDAIYKHILGDEEYTFYSNIFGSLVNLLGDAELTSKILDWLGQKEVWFGNE